MSWDMIQGLIAYGVTAILGAFGSKFILGKKITMLQELVRGVSKLLVTLVDALQPDPDGWVRVTPDEITVIRIELDRLMKILSCDSDEE